MSSLNDHFTAKAEADLRREIATGWRSLKIGALPALGFAPFINFPANGSLTTPELFTFALPFLACGLSLNFAMTGSIFGRPWPTTRLPTWLGGPPSSHQVITDALETAETSARPKSPEITALKWRRASLWGARIALCCVCVTLIVLGPSLRA